MITLNFNGTTLDVQPNDSSYRYRALMQRPLLVLKFSLPTYIEVPVGATCQYMGQTFHLNQPQDIKKQGERNIEYTLNMVGGEESLTLYKLRNTVDHRLKWSMCAKPHEFIAEIVSNLNERDGVGVWSVGTCLDATEKTIEFNHTSLDAALQSVADTFETEWEIVNFTIHLHKVEYFKDNPLPLSYGKGNGFVPGVGRTTPSGEQPIKRLYVQGGDRNIDRSQYGAPELLLPISQQLEYEGRTYQSSEDGTYIERVDVVSDAVKEDSLDCSEIYPSRIGKVSEWITVNAAKNFYDFTDLTIPNELNFNDYLIAGESMTIIFQTGMLAAKEFEVKYKHTQRRWEIVPQEIDGVVMPNDTFRPQAGENGDTYAVFGCMLPTRYICDNVNKTGASWDMFREAARHMYEHEEQKFTFSGTLQSLWSKRNWANVGGRLVVGGYVLFTDNQFAQSGVSIRITGIKDFLTSPYAPAIEISNSVTGQSVGSQLRTIEQQEVAIIETEKSLKQFTRRMFRDAQETIAMLESSLLDFGESINPVAVQTMAMLVGDESLQFRFITAADNDTPDLNFQVTYNNATMQLSCPATFLQHMTLGIGTISSSRTLGDYKVWQMQQFVSGVLADATTRYYLYAKVSTNTANGGEFVLSSTAIGMEAVNGYYHLLVGVLNSEFEGERSYVSLYGFTEILPGRITTDRIVSADGNTYFDLANGEIGGIIKFLSNGQYQTLIDGGYIKTELINARLLEVARVLAGDADGRRIEINPENKSVYIYDSNNVLVTVFEGNSYASIDALFGNSTGTVTMTQASGNHDYTPTEYDGGDTGQGTQIISDVFQTTSPCNVEFTGLLHCRVVSDANTKEWGYAQATIRLYLQTFADAACTQRIQQVMVALASCFITGNDEEVVYNADSHTLASGDNKTVIAGYHRLLVEWEMQIENTTGSGGGVDEAYIDWGNIAATWKSEVYISRFFANGFCIGTRRDNYIFAQNEASGMSLKIETGNNYGLEVSSAGVKIKRGSSTWQNL